MFWLAIDASEQGRKCVFGGLLMPEEALVNFEKDFAALRLQHKLFGEIKWVNIDQYYKKYLDFIDLLFDNKAITFHSICFRKGRRDKYNAAYSLLRTITWKLQNEGISQPLGVLFDNEGGIGRSETQKINRIALKDRNFKQKLGFCNQGVSHVLGALQLADIITGAVCVAINQLKVGPEKRAVFDYILKRNGGIPLDWTALRLPKIYQYKIHYFDPDNKSRVNNSFPRKGLK